MIQIQKQNYSKTGVCDEEYFGKTIDHFETNEEIPEITFLKRLECEDILEFDDERNKKEKIQPMRIIDIYTKTCQININPVLYKFKDSEFNVVQIEGIILLCKPYQNYKIKLTIGDNTGTIKVIFDLSPEEHEYRDEIKYFLYDLDKYQLLTREELKKYAEMPGSEFMAKVPEDKQGQLLATISSTFAHKLDIKNEIQFPKKFQKSYRIRVIGRLLPKRNRQQEIIPGKRLIYAYSIKRLLTKNEFRTETLNSYQNKIDPGIFGENYVHFMEE